MAAITAAMVGELRAKTDAPMMECKKALTEAAGDMDKAEEILRVKLGGKASKASARITAEGVVAAYISGKVGALIEVNSETDFVAKNDDFLNLANTAARLVAEHNPADLAALAALPAGEGKTLDEVRAALIGKIGENMTFRRFQRFETTGKLASYLHGARIGVMVEFEGEDQVGKDVAMHIAAMKPVALSSEQVPADLIEKERSVAAAKAKEDAEKAAAEGKPAQSEEILAKRLEGSVQKYLKEVSLFNQAFVKNDKQSIEQMLKANNASVKAFTMYVVGEGIEKKVDDFAAEVAAQMAASKQA
ncbi:MAG TPA: translation elongation factor Ts [Telluria sp.]|nr:translation elongation factor Ts [Telluria sp.]